MYNLTFLINSDLSCLQCVNIYLATADEQHRMNRYSGASSVTGSLFKLGRGRRTRTLIFHYLNYSMVTCLSRGQYLMGPRRGLKYAFVSLKRLLFLRIHLLQNRVMQRSQEDILWSNDTSLKAQWIKKKI